MPGYIEIALVNRYDPAGDGEMWRDPDGEWIRYVEFQEALRVAINRRCACGGSGPGEGCDLCDVWHEVINGQVGT